MKTLALFACLVSAAALAAEEKKDSDNLLKPANKTDSWRFEQHEGGKGEIKADGDAIVFTTTETDGTNWHVQAYQIDLDLKEGQEYVVSFEIKGEKAPSVNLSAGIDQEDWHNIGLQQDIFIGKDFKKEEHTFTATGIAANKNRIGFVLGDYKGTVTVKNMVLKAKVKAK
jgi:hypothetical protein